MENSTNYMSDYGIFNNILEGIPITIYTKDIKKENWNDYYIGLLNIFKDYIEQIFRIHLLHLYLMMVQILN